MSLLPSLLLPCVLVPQGGSQPPADEPAAMAVDDGLAFLARTQRDDGSWPLRSFSPHDRVLETTLSALAFLAAGSDIRQGEWREPLRKAVRFLRGRVPATGTITVDRPRGPDWQSYEVWYAGFLGLLFAELEDRDPSPLQRSVLRAIVRRLAALQKPGGAWCHDLQAKVRKPKGFEMAIYSDDLMVATSLAVCALARAEAVGVAVPEEVWKGLGDYFSAMQNDDGGMQYGRNHAWEGARLSEPGRTAAALLAVSLQGRGREVAAAAERYLRRNFDDLPFSAGHGGRAFQVNYLFGAMASYVSGEATWRRYRERFFPDLLRHQQEGGSFTITQGAWDTAANNTAIALLCLTAGRGHLALLEQARGALRAEEPGESKEPPRSKETEGQGRVRLGDRPALAREWLLDRQDADTGGVDGFWGSRRVDIALTAVTGLAFLATDGCDDRVRAAARYVARELDTAAQRGWRDGERSHWSFQLAFALAFLAEARGRDPSLEVDGTARALVLALQSGQHADGGWSYEGRGSLYTLSSTTAGIVIALARAQEAGLAVDSEVLEDAVSYLERCVNAGGGQRYCIDPKHPILARDRPRYLASTHARSLVAAAALAVAGRSGSEAYRRLLGSLPEDPAWLGDGGAKYFWFTRLWVSFARDDLPTELMAGIDRGLERALSTLQVEDGRCRWPGMEWARALGPDGMTDTFATATALRMLVQRE